MMLMVAVACGPTSAVGPRTTSDGDASGSGPPSDTGGDASGSGDMRPAFDPPPRPDCESSAVLGSDPLDASDCTSFATDLEATPIEVIQRIVNRGESPIVIPPMFCCVSPQRWIDVEGSAGARELRDVARCAAREAEQYWLCDWFAEGEGDSCKAPYAEHPTIGIEPGGHFETTWNAWILASGTVPETCTEASAGQACEVVLPAPPGTYVMTTRAQRLDATECTCTPDKHGSCMTSATTEEPDQLASAAWDGLCNEIALVDFLTRWPTLQAAQRARRKTLVTFFHQHNVRRADVLERRLDEIRNELPLHSDDAITKPAPMLVTALLAQLRELSKSIAAFDETIAELAPKLPDYETFASLPGAGPALAPRLLVAFGERRERFPDAASMQKFAGVAPVTERSGKNAGCTGAGRARNF